MKRLQKDILLPCLETRIEVKHTILDTCLLNGIESYGSRFVRRETIRHFRTIWKSAQTIRTWPYGYPRRTIVSQALDRGVQTSFRSVLLGGRGGGREQRQCVSSSVRTIFRKISQDFETRLREILKQDVKTCVVNTRLFGLTRDFATSRFDDVCSRCDSETVSTFSKTMR